MFFILTNIKRTMLSHTYGARTWDYAFTHKRSSNVRLCFYTLTELERETMLSHSYGPRTWDYAFTHLRSSNVRLCLHTLTELECETMLSHTNGALYIYGSFIFKLEHFFIWCFLFFHYWNVECLFQNPVAVSPNRPYSLKTTANIQVYKLT